jgi:hypothetical protein
MKTTENLTSKRLRAALYATYAEAQAGTLNIKNIQKHYHVGRLGEQLQELGRLTRTGSRRFAKWLWMGAPPDEALLVDLLKIRDQLAKQSTARKKEKAPAPAAPRFITKVEVIKEKPATLHLEKQDTEEPPLSAYLHQLAERRHQELLLRIDHLEEQLGAILAAVNTPRTVAPAPLVFPFNLPKAEEAGK